MGFKRAVTASVTIAFFGMTMVAQAGTIKVTTKADQYATGTGCSIREAIQSFNNQADFGGCDSSGTYSERSRITLGKGVHKLAIAGALAGNQSGDLNVANFNPLTILGSRKGSTIDGNQLDRVFQLSGARLTLKRLTVTGGRTVHHGGGIFAGSSTLVVDSSTISGNVAGSAGGSFAGGGIGSATADVTIRSSTISGNRSGSAGGGVDFSTNPGPAQLLTISNSTITKNIANTGDNNVGGGGISFQQDSLRLSGSIVAGNRVSFGALGADCRGFVNVASLGRNLIGDNTGCESLTPGPRDIRNTVAKLTRLKNNGGPTKTHALKRSSPAVNKGGKSCPSRDQRGVKRSKGGKRCDIGAYELVKRKRRR